MVIVVCGCCRMILHASSAAVDGNAVLLLGPPGSGKSDLLLRLLQDREWRLVADDQVEIATCGGGLCVAPPPTLRGLLEVRGVGVIGGLPVADPPPRLRLVVRLARREEVPRLPEPQSWAWEGRTVPALALHAFDASSPAKVGLALAAATGRLRAVAGAVGTECPAA